MATFFYHQEHYIQKKGARKSNTQNKMLIDVNKQFKSDILQHENEELWWRLQSGLQLHANLGKAKAMPIPCTSVC